MRMNSPLAAAIPARSANPYPRCATWITRAPSFSAISTEPSVEPLSATTTSPRSLAARKACIAFSTHTPIEFASFKQGITTDTSAGCASASASTRVEISVLTAGALPTSTPDYLRSQLLNSDGHSNVAKTSGLHFPPPPLSWRHDYGAQIMGPDPWNVAKGPLSSPIV